MVLKTRLTGFEPITFGTEIRHSIHLSYKRFIIYMIQQQTVLKVSDNSGAKLVKCIKVLGGLKKKIANVGDVVVVSVLKLRNKAKKSSKVKKGEVLKALIIRTKSKKHRPDGSCMWFGNNAVSLLNKQNKPLGSRILGPFSVVALSGNSLKIVSTSQKIL